MSVEALTERLPTAEEAQKATEASTALAKALNDQGGLPFTVSEDGGEVGIELPPAVGQIVIDLLGHIARGEMVTFVPYSAELTTQKAADLLNVSRPFLTKMLEAGDIPFHRVGSHRRVRVEDLLAYKERRDIERSESLRELQRLGQEFDAG